MLVNVGFADRLVEFGLIRFQLQGALEFLNRIVQVPAKGEPLSLQLMVAPGMGNDSPTAHRSRLRAHGSKVQPIARLDILIGHACYPCQGISRMIWMPQRKLGLAEREKLRGGQRIASFQGS